MPSPATFPANPLSANPFPAGAFPAAALPFAGSGTTGMAPGSPSSRPTFAPAATPVPVALRGGLVALALGAALALVHAPAAAQDTMPSPPGGQAAEPGDAARLAALIEAWLASPHGDYASPSFTHWNEEGAVPEDCAACHSEPGMIDFLGADGSAAGQVDHPAAINAPIGCPACHTAAAHALEAVAFPSGVTVGDLGASATCTVCHQGRASGGTVAAAVGAAPEDAVLPEQGFINIHYAVAAATLNGAVTQGGYHYPGRSYAGRFAHVPSADSCVDCHDPHRTEVAVEGCLACHRGIEELRDIRTRHSDFDGDGDTAEGVHAEIATLHDRLGAAIGAYGAQVAGAPIGYAPDTFPYFFNDPDADGTIGPDEGLFPNRYQSWTPRLLKAAYNYQMVAKDPGGYAHNPAYLLQLMHDSLQSLSERVPVETEGLQRP